MANNFQRNVVSPRIEFILLHSTAVCFLPKFFSFFFGEEHQTLLKRKEVPHFFFIYQYWTKSVFPTEALFRTIDASYFHKNHSKLNNENIFAYIEIITNNKQEKNLKMSPKKVPLFFYNFFHPSLFSYYYFRISLSVTCYVVLSKFFQS